MRGLYWAIWLGTTGLFSFALFLLVTFYRKQAETGRGSDPEEDA